MKDILIIGEPAVKIPVTRMDTGKLLGLERTLEYQFLPHTIVGRKIDVLKKLTIQKRVNLSSNLGGINFKFHLLLLLRSCGQWQENKRQQ